MTFSDNPPAMLGSNGKYVYERALLVLAEAAARLGIVVDVEELAPTRREAGADRLVPAAEYQAAVGAIFADPRETLGIDLAQALPIQSSGLWGFLLRSSPTFGDMLRRAERYIRVAFRHTRLVLTDRGETVVLACDHPDPSPFGRREQEVAFFLGQWLTWGRRLVGDDVAAQAVAMRWQGPADPAPWQAFFGCPVRFGADDDTLTFRRSVLDLPLPEHTPELAQMFGNYAAALVQRLGPETSFVDRVREALAEGLLSDAAGEAAVAGRLGITVRTLHRRLAEAESSFRRLRSELLRMRAEQLLSEEKLPIAEVSYLLGYAEPSTFHRAFRRWTGVAPAEWRSRTTPSAIV